MKTNRLANIALVFLLVITTTLMLVPGLVRASGSTSETFYPATDDDDKYWATTVWQNWNTQIQTDAPGTFGSTGAIWCGWSARTANPNYWNIMAGAVSIDISALTVDVEDVTDIKIRLKTKVLQSNRIPETYFALYELLDTDGWDLGDFDSLYEQGGVRVSNVMKYSDLVVDEWIEIPLTQNDLYCITPNINGEVNFYLATTNHGLPSAPAYVSEEAIQIHFYDYAAGADKPQLVISYIEDAVDREPVIDSNDPVDTTIVGDEVADNVTWQTPRNAYADENLYLKVNGDSGASITLELVDQDGVILDQVDDSVRTDGNYDYTIDLPDSWFGFVRLFETTHNVKSDWGYVMPRPDADQVNNTVYAVNTEHPQYNFAFSRYLTYENDAFVLHFKTNIQDDEHADHDLNLYSNGDSDNTTIIFSQSFDWLNDNYYNASANNSFLNAWRFMIMTPNIEGSGFEDYDGLIYDLSYDYSSYHAGFLQAKILDTTDNSTLANSHSCYWYLPAEQDGLIFRLNRSSYNKAEPLLIDLQIGTACQVTDTIYNLVITIIDDTGATVETRAESIVAGLNEYAYTAPVTSGNYEVRFTFSTDDISWSYIHDEPFSVKGTATQEGAQSIIDNIRQWIENTGLATTTGYWVLLLLGMVVLFLLAYKSPLMRVVFPLVYLGLFMIWEFIDSWLIILLALGAGLTLYGIFRKKTGGGGGGSEEG